jgi:hypothetical protein
MGDLARLLNSCAALACIIHQRWKVTEQLLESRVRGRRRDRFGDRARVRGVGRDGEGILRQGLARNRQERVSSKRDERLACVAKPGDGLKQGLERPAAG